MQIRRAVLSEGISTIEMVEEARGVSLAWSIASRAGSSVLLR